MTKLYDSEDNRKYAEKSYEVPLGEAMSEEEAQEEFEQGLKLLKAKIISTKRGGPNEFSDD